MEQRIAPSVQIEAAIEAVLAGGLGDPDALSTLGRLGAQLVLQRAVEDEVAVFLRRARYERTPDAAGSRNGSRPRRVQTAEGEITIAVPQVRDTLTRFVSQVIPDTRSIIRTRPLEALVIGAYVRGLSDRDVESLAREAGLGTISRTAVHGRPRNRARRLPRMNRPPHSSHVRSPAAAENSGSAATWRGHRLPGSLRRGAHRVALLARLTMPEAGLLPWPSDVSARARGRGRVPPARVAVATPTQDSAGASGALAPAYLHSRRPHGRPHP